MGGGGSVVGGDGRGRSETLFERLVRKLCQCCITKCLKEKHFYWSIVDLYCCVAFYCTQSDSVIYINTSTLFRFSSRIVYLKLPWWPYKHSFFFRKIYYYRRIIALQYYVDFYHTSTWISHRYTYGTCSLLWFGPCFLFDFLDKHMLAACT